MFEYYYITIVKENAKLAIKMKILTYQVFTTDYYSIFYR